MGDKLWIYRPLSSYTTKMPKLKIFMSYKSNNVFVLNKKIKNGKYNLRITKRKEV